MTSPPEPGDLEKLLEYRRLNPFWDALDSRIEPRILSLVPAHGARLDANGKVIFEGIAGLMPLFVGAGRSAAWVFPDSDSTALVAAARDRGIQIVVNTLADPDMHSAALAVAAEICRSFPTLNSPERVLGHARERVASALSGIDGLDAPACRRMVAVQENLRKIDTYPAILRCVGTFQNRTMQLVYDDSTAADFVSRHEGREIYAIDFRDYRSDDGWYRKYRAIVVGGEAHPFHIDFGRTWASSSDQTRDALSENPWMSDEESAFLTSPVSGSHARIFSEITNRIGTDIYAVDYGVQPDNTVVLFEANAFQNIDRPAWRKAFPPVFEATRKLHRSARMLLARKILDVRTCED